jgi:cation transport ATPase
MTGSWWPKGETKSDARVGLSTTGPNHVLLRRAQDAPATPFSAGGGLALLQGLRRVARNERLFGAITVADTVRPEAQRAVAALAGIGIRTILLTGDRASPLRLLASTPITRPG